MKLLPLSALALALVSTVAASASAQVLTTPPPASGGPSASAIFDAMLAIARAASTNPAAAQNATFSYQAAIQQFNAHDFDRARLSAITAIMQTAAVPLPQPTLAPPPIPTPRYAPMPLLVSSKQADAESFVALARRALTICGAPSATPPAAIFQTYSNASAALVAKQYATARTDSQYVIDQCAAATQAYAARQAALPQPAVTPIPFQSYSPIPVATLIPDPALQGTSH